MTAFTQRAQDFNLIASGDALRGRHADLARFFATMGWDVVTVAPGRRAVSVGGELMGVLRAGDAGSARFVRA